MGALQSVFPLTPFSGDTAMFSSQSKIVTRIVFIMVVLLAVTVAAGCSMESSTPESKEAALKSLSTLSDEDKAVEKKDESATSSQGEGGQEKQLQPATTETSK